MKCLLICSSNPIFVKNLYGTLRTEGYDIDVVERTAMAVQESFRKKYVAVIMDPNAIGLSASDAAEIIRRSGTNVLMPGSERVYEGLGGTFDFMQMINEVRCLDKSTVTR